MTKRYRGNNPGARPPVSQLENGAKREEIPNPFKEYYRLNGHDDTD